jgi:hypothetical protein
MNAIALHMIELPLLISVLALSHGMAQADSLTITDQNASLTFTRNDPGSAQGFASDPVQLPERLEWNVDGRRILLYPSGPSHQLDIGHLHPGAHVTPSQIHAQGPLLGYGTNASEGTVTGGMVYTVVGDAPGSGRSRIWEKVDVVNKTANPIGLPLIGLGRRPQADSGLEVPDLTGLTITGTTTVSWQGNAGPGPSISDPPYGPVAVLPPVTFSGFNPLVQTFELPAGATLTMITDMTVTVGQ